jgi:hypothetical protein
MFDDSFAAGMLEAVVQAMVHDRPITMIAYDVPYPEPLHTARPIVSMFGMAMVLSPGRTGRAIASLTLATADGTPPATAMADPALEQLRLGNPAARALPVLAAVARGDTDTIRLNGIDITVAPP